MADPSTRLGRPDAESDRDCTSGQHPPADPCRLTRKADQDDQGDESQETGGIDKGSGNPGPSGMLVKGGIASLIQRRLDRSVHKGLPGPLARFHDRRGRAGAEKDRQQTRGEGSTAVEKNADEHRKTRHRQSDDRNVIEGEMQMGRSKERVHGPRLVGDLAADKEEERQTGLDTERRILQKNTMNNGQGSAGNVIASLASFFIPGLGQLIQGRLLPAILFFVFTGILWIFLLGWIIHLWACLDAALWKPRS